METTNKHIDQEEKRLLELTDVIENMDSLSDAELQELFADEAHREDFLMMQTLYNAHLKSTSPIPNVDRAWDDFEQRHIALSEVHHIWKMRMAWLVGIAAAILILFMVMSHRDTLSPTHPLVAFSANDEPSEVMLITDDQPPVSLTGKNKTSGTVVNNNTANFSHLPTQSVTTKTLSTPRGKTFKIILPDQTEVVLNAESRLTFPTRFEGSTRIVKLEGEAYFKVAKNAAKPFIVQSDRISTRVLGTEFNFKAYKTAVPHVTLISGSVIVNSSNAKQEIKLKPGEDASLTEADEFNIIKVDPVYYTQWKDGFFYFDNLPLIDIVREIGRWYNISVEITDNSLLSYRLHFIADRTASINQVVENLNAFSYLSAKMENNKMILSKK